MEPCSDEYMKEQSKLYGNLDVLADIISLRAADSPFAKIFAYPRPESDTDEYYETFTAVQLNNFIDVAVKKFIKLGHEPSLGLAVGLLGATNLDYVVTIFALSRLGYAVVLLSMRLKPAAIASLLKSTNANAIIHDASPTATATVKAANEIATVKMTPMVVRSEYDISTNDTPAPRFFTAEEQKPTSALVFHSSGSTGMPKPIHMKHKDLARSICTTGLPMNTIVTRPLYHGWGHTCLLNTLYCGKTAYLIDTSKPATTDSLVEAFEAAQSAFIPAVPNVLELLAQSPRGIECLKKAEAVTTGGARMPEELGDALIKQGVNFSATFGSSEATSCFGSSMFRPRSDNDWDYIEFLPIYRQHILMDPVGGGLHEVVLLGTFPGLASTNTDKPVSGSCRTGDIMEPHPTKDAWKFVSRTGDFLALATGEKVLGFPIEDRVRESPLVEEAVVVGLGKPTPGLLVRPSQKASLSKAEYFEAIWPFIQSANEVVDQFSEIERAKVHVLDRGVDFPRTDKGNVIRPQVYSQFGREIDDLYEN